MPNTPAQVGAGASLMALSTKIESEWKDLGLKLLDSLGVGIVVTEEQLNIATPYSGSGTCLFLSSNSAYDRRSKRAWFSRGARSHLV